MFGAGLAAAAMAFGACTPAKSTRMRAWRRRDKSTTRVPIMPARRVACLRALGLKAEPEFAAGLLAWAA